MFCTAMQEMAIKRVLFYQHNCESLSTFSILRLVDMKCVKSLHKLLSHILLYEAFLFTWGITAAFSVAETAANGTLQDTGENESS